MSKFATSDNISDLANRISVESANRSNADSSITSALAAETAAREATDPIFVEFSIPAQFTYFSSTAHDLIMKAVTYNRVLIGYQYSSSSAVRICFPIHVAYLNNSFVVLSFIFNEGANSTTPLSIFYTITYSISNLYITTVTASRLNAPSVIVYDGSNFINSSCLWRAVNAPAHVQFYSSSIILTHGTNHKIFLHPNYATKYTLPDSSTDGGLINGETFEFINASYRTTSFYANSTTIYSADNKLYPYPENNTSSSGVSYYYIHRNERCKVECTYSTNINGWYIIKTPLINSAIYNKPTYAEGLQPMILAYGKGGAYTGSGNSTSTELTYRTFDNSTMSLSRTSTGVYYLYIPSTWYSNSGAHNNTLVGSSTIYRYTNYLLVFVTGIASASTRAGNATKIYASVGNMSSSYITIRTADDASENDGVFSFIIYSI